MNNLATEYRAAVQGTSTNGFGYFIAVPSLHVAVATLCQLVFFARRSLILILHARQRDAHHEHGGPRLPLHHDASAGNALGAAVYFAWFKPLDKGVRGRWLTTR
jgi:hypothetical protein